jgi:hypothetical protein
MPKHFLQSKEKSVPVLNGNMIELSPVTPGKARLLIKKKKAKTICTNPLTLRLNYVKEIQKENHLNVNNV